MIETEKLRFRKGDWLAVGLVVFLAVSIVLCFLPKNDRDGGYAEIYLNGQLVKTVTLDNDQVFTVSDRFTNEITVSGGKIALTASDCPGQDCVHSGGIESAGRSIVCLPNGVEIRVISADADVDFVVG